MKLFGVRLTDGSIIKKSASMGNLSALAVHHRLSPLATGNHNDSPLSDHGRYSSQENGGYLSDDPGHGSGSIHHRRVERKRGKRDCLFYFFLLIWVSRLNWCLSDC